MYRQLRRGFFLGMTFGGPSSRIGCFGPSTVEVEHTIEAMEQLLKWPVPAFKSHSEAAVAPPHLFFHPCHIHI